MTVSRRTLALAVGVAVAAPALSAIAQASAGPREHHVAIRNFSFEPTALEVRDGDVVVWTNHDIAPHTATATDETWDSATLQRGESFSLTISPGTAESYFCRFHPMMKAALRLAGQAG